MKDGQRHSERAAIPTVASAAKKSFGNVFMVGVVVLMVLPMVSTFNEFLTRVAQSTFVFKAIESVLVPYEVMLVRTIISYFGIETAPGTVAVIRDGVNYNTFIAWNCIGWQSVLILMVSLKSGLVRGFTKASRLEALALALVGTFVMNLARISAILIILFYFGREWAFFFHDYLSIVITVLWLLGFWSLLFLPFAFPACNAVRSTAGRSVLFVHGSRCEFRRAGV